MRTALLMTRVLCRVRQGEVHDGCPVVDSRQVRQWRRDCCTALLRLYSRPSSRRSSASLPVSSAQRSLSTSSDGDGLTSQASMSGSAACRRSSIAAVCTQGASHSSTSSSTIRTPSKTSPSSDVWRWRIALPWLQPISWRNNDGPWLMAHMTSHLTLWLPDVILH